LSLDLSEEKEGASLMSFGREFRIRGPADRKPRETSVVLRRGSTRRSAEEDRSDRSSIVCPSLLRVCPSLHGMCPSRHWNVSVFPWNVVDEILSDLVYKESVSVGSTVCFKQGNFELVNEMRRRG